MVRLIPLITLILCHSLYQILYIWFCCSSHKEVENIFLPFNYEVSHMVWFSQWMVSRYDTSKDLKSAYTLCLSPEFCECQEDMHNWHTGRWKIWHRAKLLFVPAEIILDQVAVCWSPDMRVNLAKINKIPREATADHKSMSSLTKSIKLNPDQINPRAHHLNKCLLLNSTQVLSMFVMQHYCDNRVIVRR